jgi:hypothetical protein
MKTSAILFALIIMCVESGCSKSTRSSSTTPKTNTAGVSTDTILRTNNTWISEERAVDLAIIEARNHGWPNSKLFGVHRRGGKWIVILFKFPEEIGQNAIVELSSDGTVVTFLKGH